MRVAAFLAILTCGVTARADAPTADELAQARAADESARVHYDLHEYEAAIADYRRAFEALHDPLFLFNIAQAYRQLHDCKNAREMYRTYLRNKPDADNRAKVEQFIAELEDCANQPPPSSSPPPSPPAHSSALPIAGAITAAVGLAGLGSGIYFSIVGAHRASDLDAACAQGCDGSTVASIDRDGHDANRNATIAYAIGGAAFAAGAGMLIWAWLDRRGEHLTVTPTPGGATVMMRF